MILQNKLNKEKGKSAEALCERSAENALDRCETFAPILKENVIAAEILKSGCVDKTGLAVIGK